MPVRVKVEEQQEETISVEKDAIDDGMQIDNNDNKNSLNDKDNDDDDDDEIIREMDVYLSPQLVSQLYLLQYPLQHCYSVSSSSPPSSSSSPSLQQQLQKHHKQKRKPPLAARIKPQHNILELDQEIPMNGIEQQGLRHLHQRTFGSHTVPVTTHMALGKIVGDSDETGEGENNKNRNKNNKLSLHLIPLHHITQMRPSFAHIDQEDTEKAAAAAAAATASTAAAEEEEQQQVLSTSQQQQQSSAAADNTTTTTTSTTTKERKPLMFQKKESERAAMARKSSFAYKKASEESEEWITLNVIDDDDDDDDNEDDDIDIDSDDRKAQVALLRQQMDCPAELRNQYVLDGNNVDNYASSTTIDNCDVSYATESMASYVHSLDYIPSAGATYDRAPVGATTANLSINNNNDDDDDDTEYGEKQTFLVDWKQSGRLNDDTILDLPTIGAHLTTVLCKGWPMPFSILRETLPPIISEQDILTALTSCAVLVRGNYVLQSRLLQLPKTVAKARTFILLLLQSMGVIHRNRLDYVFGIVPKNLPVVTTKKKKIKNDNDNDNYEDIHNRRGGVILQDENITAETILMLLEQVAQKTPDGWVLKVQDDVDFLSRLPENTNIYMEYWGRQMLRFQDNLQRYASIDI